MRLIFSLLFWSLVGLFLYSKLFLWIVGLGENLIETNTKKKLEKQIQITSSLLLQSLLRSDTAYINHLLAYDYVKNEKKKTALRECRNFNIIFQKHPLKDWTLDDISIGRFNEINVWYYLIRKPDSALNIEQASLRIDFYPYEFQKNDSQKILDYDLNITPLIKLFYLNQKQRDSIPFDYEDYKM